MKVNFGQEPYTVRVDTLLVGDTFLADRTKGQGRGIYMVVDKNNGVMSRPLTQYKIVAVNLESGQLRPFSVETHVEPIHAEVKVGATK